MLLEWLGYFAYKLPAAVGLSWIVLLIAESIRANPIISAVAKKYDPEGDFVRRRDYGMGFGSNSFWVDKKHPACTQDFLDEWDRTHGVHWRRLIVGFILFPIVCGIAQGVQYLIRLVIY